MAICVSIFSSLYTNEYNKTSSSQTPLQNTVGCFSSLWKQTKRTQIIQSFYDLRTECNVIEHCNFEHKKVGNQHTQQNKKTRLVLHFFFPLYIMPCTVKRNGKYATSFIISQYFKDAEIHYNFCAVSRSAHLTSLIISLLGISFRL